MYFYKIIDVVDFSTVNTPISTIALILRDCMFPNFDERKLLWNILLKNNYIIEIS